MRVIPRGIHFLHEVVAMEYGRKQRKAERNTNAMWDTMRVQGRGRRCWRGDGCGRAFPW